MQSIDTAHFNDWSPWSECNRKCLQNRVKLCTVKNKCGNTILMVSDRAFNFYLQKILIECFSTGRAYLFIQKTKAKGTM